jgi:hypothetical protein
VADTNDLGVNFPLVAERDDPHHDRLPCVRANLHTLKSNLTDKIERINHRRMEVGGNVTRQIALMALP